MTALMNTPTTGGTISRSGYTSMSYVCTPSTRSTKGAGVSIVPERPALAAVTAADRWRSSSPPWEWKRELFGWDELFGRSGASETHGRPERAGAVTLSPHG